MKMYLAISIAAVSVLGIIVSTTSGRDLIKTCATMMIMTDAQRAECDLNGKAPVCIPPLD